MPDAAPRHSLVIVFPSRDRSWLAAWDAMLRAAQARGADILVVTREGEEAPTGVGTIRPVVGPADGDVATLRQLGMTAAMGDIVTMVGPDTPVRPAGTEGEWAAWLTRQGVSRPGGSR